MKIEDTTSIQEQATTLLQDGKHYNATSYNQDRLSAHIYDGKEMGISMEYCRQSRENTYSFSR